MSNNVWMYRYLNIDDFFKCEKKFDVISRKCNDYDVYEIAIPFFASTDTYTLNKNSSISSKKIMYIPKFSNKETFREKDIKIRLMVIKELNLICIIADKYKYVNYLFNKYNIKKVNLLDNNLFTNIFEKHFSDNLVRICFDSESDNATVDQLELAGNNLFESNILHGFDVFSKDKATKIIKYSFQPRNFLFIVAIKSVNKIEIRSKLKCEYEVLEFLYEFSMFMIRYGGENDGEQWETFRTRN
jgi:hypothetical protein